MSFRKPHQDFVSTHFIFLLGITGVLLALFSCKSTLNTEAPRKTVDEYITDRQLSAFNIPISISLKDLQKNINNLYKSILYEDNSFDNNGKDNLIFRIEKTSEIVIGSSAGKINVKLPLRVKAKYRFAKRVLGVDLETVQDANFNITVNLNSKPEISPDWKTKVKTTTDIQWHDLSDFDFGIDISKGINEIIKGQIESVSALIDKQITESLDLKKMVGEQWKKLHEPILMDETMSAWLVIEPKLVYLTPFKCEGNKVDFKLGFKSFIGMVLGDKPVTPAAGSLPNLMQMNDLKDEFSLSLSTDLGFRQIENIINKQIADSTFLFDDKVSFITIKKVEVYGSNEKLIMGVDLKGRVKSGIITKKIEGKFFFQGVPVYDNIKKTISIKDFDFEIKSRDVLLKAAKWMVVNKKFKQNIEKKMVFPVSEQLKQANILANKSVNQRVNGFVSLSGQIIELEPTDISLSEKSIRLNIKALGNLQVALDQFDIK
jgi:hypothetical protein